MVPTVVRNESAHEASVVTESALRAILRSLGTAPSFRDCMRECALTLHKSTHADGATVYRLAKNGTSLERIHSVGFTRRLTDLSQQLGPTGSLTGLAVREKKLLTSESLGDDERIAPEYREELVAGGMQSVVALPLFMHAEVVGAITLAWRRPLPLSARDRDLLMYVGFGIAIAVEHDLREFESVRDGLTGLENRRAFDAKFPELIEACRATGAPLSLVMFDLDNFKRCNDTHGHGVGDIVLKTTAQQIAKHMMLERGGVYRVGGEEFVLLLPNTRAADAVAMVERMCRSVSAQIFHGKEAMPFQVTLSVGIAEYNVLTSESRDDFYARADQAMYRAKQAGKDRIVVAE